MPRPAREGGNKRCFCPSIRPSRRPHIANNSRTQRPDVPKFGRKTPHLRCDLHTSFKVKRSKVRVTRPINADTHRAHICECQGWWTSNLVHRCTTTTLISYRRHDLQGQRSRSQGHEISLSRVGPMAHKSKTNSRSITQIGRIGTRATLHTSFKVKRSKVKVTGRLT